MEAQLSQFILDKSFPCIMAKSVIQSGLIKIIKIKSSQINGANVLQELYDFIDDYRLNAKKLRSFVVVFDGPGLDQFEEFEKEFWSLLSELNLLDKRNFAHDARVSSDPASPSYSFSLKSEAFFILALHPKSPRIARRFFKPAVVFNLHQQFEQMRKKGVFSKVRALIRKKDEILQGSINPMLADFGERSEIFQYLGKTYQNSRDLIFPKGLLHGSH